MTKASRYSPEGARSDTGNLDGDAVHCSKGLRPAVDIAGGPHHGACCVRYGAVCPLD